MSDSIRALNVQAAYIAAVSHAVWELATHIGVTTRNFEPITIDCAHVGKRTILTWEDAPSDSTH